MGGGNVIDDYSEKLLEISKELRTVSFYVDFSDSGNMELFDRDYLYKRYCKEVKEYLKSIKGNWRSHELLVYWDWHMLGEH